MLYPAFVFMLRFGREIGQAPPLPLRNFALAGFFGSIVLFLAGYLYGRFQRGPAA